MSNIKLKNASGVETTYNGVTSIKVPLADGTGNATFTEGSGSSDKIAFFVGGGSASLTCEDSSATWTHPNVNEMLNKVVGPFFARSGMTFAEWIASDEFDHTGWSIVGGVVFYLGDMILPSYAVSDVTDVTSTGPNYCLTNIQLTQVYPVNKFSNYSGNSTYDTNVILNNMICYVCYFCFVAGTKILLDAEGNSKYIEDIVPGDMVMSFDHEKNIYRQSIVTHIFKNEDSTNIFRLKDGENWELIVTGNHPLFTTDGVYKTIEMKGDRHLHVGDTLVGYEENHTITEIQYYEGNPEDTYSFNVRFPEEEVDRDDFDNYIANGVIAHNAVCLLGDTLITLSDGRKKRIDEFSIDDKVLAYNEKGELVEDTLREYDDGRCNFYKKYTFENGYEVKVARMHKFYNVEKQKMIDLEYWKIGEHAYTEDKKEVALINIELIKEDVHYYHIYNLYGNYFANGLLADGQMTQELHLKGQE